MLYQLIYEPYAITQTLQCQLLEIMGPFALKTLEQTTYMCGMLLLLMQSMTLPFFPIHVLFQSVENTVGQLQVQCLAPNISCSKSWRKLRQQTRMDTVSLEYTDLMHTHTHTHTHAHMHARTHARTHTHTNGGCLLG